MRSVLDRLLPLTEPIEYLAGDLFVKNERFPAHRSFPGRQIPPGFEKRGADNEVIEPFSHHFTETCDNLDALRYSVEVIGAEYIFLAESCNEPPIRLDSCTDLLHLLEESNEHHHS